MNLNGIRRKGANIGYYIQRGVCLVTKLFSSIDFVTHHVSEPYISTALVFTFFLALHNIRVTVLHMHESSHY